MSVAMRIKRLVLDVDKGIGSPSVLELARAIGSVESVDAFNITVTEIDLETVGMDVAVEGVDVDYEALLRAIERAGAVVHSIDELAAGDRIVPYPVRRR
jgi:hypothetical protein